MQRPLAPLASTGPSVFPVAVVVKAISILVARYGYRCVLAFVSQLFLVTRSASSHTQCQCDRSSVWHLPLFLLPAEPLPIQFQFPNSMEHMSLNTLTERKHYG